MPFSRTGNPYRRRNVLIPGGMFLTGTVLLLIAFVLFLVHTFAPGFLMRVAAPVWNVGAGASSVVSTLSSTFGNGAALTRQRDRLAEENLALNEENRILRAQVVDLGKFGEGGVAPDRVAAGVLARPPVAPYDTLVVMVPKGHTTSVGAFAYGAGGVPLGTIETVSGDIARISLFSTGGRVTEGWVGEKRIPVTLTGRGAGAFEATLPRESGAQVNDVVYVPGPGALPIGSIARIDSDPSSPRDLVHIAPYANVFSITQVELAR